MAIKTKKITDLGKITINAESNKLTDGDFYVIGCKAGVTGKVATGEIYKEIENLITDKLKSRDASITSFRTDVEGLKETVGTLSNQPAPTAIVDCDCADKIATLEAKVAALEGFMQALQKDGYLTLKEIQKAAAEACPICNHTHEEEQAAE